MTGTKPGCPATNAILAPLLIVLLGILPGSVRAAEINVVASIRPLQLIAQAVLGDSAEAQVILPPGANTHHYSLRPSDLKKIGRASLLIWLGEQHEPYLSKVVRAKGAGQVLDAGAVSASYRDDDPHLWLSPENALSIARHITARLSEMNPALQHSYRANLMLFEQRLKTLALQSAGLSREVLPYIVYHDAFGYFEREYGLRRLAVASKHHELKPSARQLLKLRGVINRENVQCILVLPGSDEGVLDILMEKRPLRVKIFDPLAGDVALEPSAYVKWLSELVVTIRDCAGKPA